MRSGRSGSVVSLTKTSPKLIFVSSFMDIFLLRSSILRNWQKDRIYVFPTSDSALIMAVLVLPGFMPTEAITVVGEHYAALSWSGIDALSIREIVDDRIRSVPPRK